jgi:hypothetical protein
MNQGEPLVQAPGQEEGTAPRWRWSRPVALVFLAVLILAPLVLVATRGATLSGLYEESVGFRYFYSLRTVLGENSVLFLPQGQIQDLLSQAIQIALNFAGYQLYDTEGRIDAFSYSLVACAMLLALFAFWFGNAEQGEGPTACLLAATLWGSTFYLPGYNTVYSLLQPDYLPFILAIGIGANALIARLVPGGTISPWRDAVVFGLFLGLCLATKLTLAVFAATAMGAYIIERPHRRGLLIVTGAGLIGIGIWLAAIKLDYRGSGTKLTNYYAYLGNFVQSSGNVPAQSMHIVKWACSKLSLGSYLHGALVILPGLVAMVFCSCRRSRRSVLASVFVGVLAYCYLLYKRDYPGSNMEVAVFLCFAVLCLWRELSRQFSEGMGRWVMACSSITIIVFALSMDIAVARFTVLSIVESAVANTAAQSRLREALSTLPKPILWLMPTNLERPLSVHSAIMKGRFDREPPEERGERNDAQNQSRSRLRRRTSMAAYAAKCRGIQHDHVHDDPGDR